ncbi:hypothetical protein [Streptomyces sp. MBT53]|uniref:hypothetical protein n=1 Tax=Streptomyces sp. MBT53 TaxID=1488384 RepID=UPI0019132B90|nr:hypothetical protein [Streptomyces sp. MBT53]MBK6017717.1 hypothetical protein [Streptomyces sp. MBT53]
MTSANNRAMPLDDYLLNAKQLDSISSAYSLSIAGCMHKYGFSYSIRKSSINSGMGADAPSSRVDGRFGYQSMTHAKKWGYHPEGGFPQSGKLNTSPAIGPEKWFALAGTRDLNAESGPGGLTRSGAKVPSRGCTGSALLAITGSRNGHIGDSEIATSLNFDTLVAGQKDPRTLKVFSLWSRCMQEYGYSYNSPLDALSDSTWAKSSKPSSAEIKTAAADQKCRAQHNVVGVWFAADFEYQERAVKNNRTALTKAKEQIRRQVSAAQKIIKKS